MCEGFTAWETSKTSLISLQFKNNEQLITNVVASISLLLFLWQAQKMMTVDVLLGVWGSETNVCRHLLFASYHWSFDCILYTLDVVCKLFARDTSLINFISRLQNIRYTRNLVDAGNDRFNLMILCWNEGQSSAIHDHADSHCFMKVLKGGLTEVKYSWPQEQSGSALISSFEPKCADIGAYQNENEEYEQQLQEIARSAINTNEVCYINGNLDF